MPLDDDAQAVLQMFEEQGVPPFDSLPPDQAKVVFGDVFATAPEDKLPLARVEDRTIPGPAGEIPIRIYSPSASEALPGLLHYHGGGWVILNLETHDGFCRRIAAGAECTVVAVDYRLAPEHKYPAAMLDCYAALLWVAENAAEVGVDADRLGVIGDSAGGNLAAAVALRVRDQGGPELRLQLLNYPALDPTMAMPSIAENAEGYFLTRSSMEWFWGHYMSEETDLEDPYLAPLVAKDLSGLPAAMVVTAEFDPLRDDGEAYADRLQEAGVPVELRRFDGVFHGFVFMGDAIAKAKQALELELRFLRAAFK